MLLSDFFNKIGRFRPFSDFLKKPDKEYQSTEQADRD
jgi:hypothetical protein